MLYCGFSHQIEKKIDRAPSSSPRVSIYQDVKHKLKCLVKILGMEKLKIERNCNNNNNNSNNNNNYNNNNSNDKIDMQKLKLNIKFLTLVLLICRTFINTCNIL